MRRYILVSLFFFLFLIGQVNAKSGCCSHHNGVAGCNQYGRIVCNDGTISPTCTCEPEIISTVQGCMDISAKNYNKNATQDDGSCIYYKKGCTDVDALNYDDLAEKDDGSCILKVVGCMDKSAKNYDQNANVSGDCLYQSVEENATNSQKNVDEESNGNFMLGFLTLGAIVAGATLKKKRRRIKF